jgi:hypothetical protein
MNKHYAVKIYNGNNIFTEIYVLWERMFKLKFGLHWRDFLYLDVHSQLAFNAMDRNKDGFITKGELKLAKKKMSMKDVEEARRIFLKIRFYTKGKYSIARTVC